MKKETALKLLALAQNYTLAELHAAYHQRLFDIHPDTSAVRFEDAGRLLEETVLARKTLEEALTQKAPLKESFSAEPGRDGYTWYRQASAIMSTALQDYWRERLRWSQIPVDSPQLKEIAARLTNARELFARVLTEFPGGTWTPDAVDEIARINLWLGGQSRPFSE